MLVVTCVVVPSDNIQDCQPTGRTAPVICFAIFVLCLLLNLLRKKTAATVCNSKEQTMILSPLYTLQVSEFSVLYLVCNTVSQ